MPSFRLRNEDGTFTQFAVHIRPFLTHEQTLPKYQGKASFEITEMSLQTSVGTYLDSPHHRYSDGRDISQIRLDEAILAGVVVDVRGRKGAEPVGVDALPASVDLRGKAVLFNFGWDAHWGAEAYHSYPYIDRALIERLIAAGARLVGVDTVNVDDARDLERPAHTLLLKNDILIVENLTGLKQLHGRSFRFYAVPLRAKKAAVMPIRAFAEVGGV